MSEKKLSKRNFLIFCAVVLCAGTILKYLFDVEVDKQKRSLHRTASSAHENKTMAKKETLTVQIINHVPGHYALIIFSGVDPLRKLDEEKIKAYAQEKMAEMNVESLQIVAYDMGKKKGDGVRALGELNKEDKKPDHFWFRDLIAEFFETDVFDEERKKEIDNSIASLHFKMVENSMGYTVSPEIIYDAYQNNEVAADEDFKNKPSIMEIIVPQVSKNALDNAYMEIDVTKDRFLSKGLHIYFKPDDPFLRHVRRGDKVLLRVYSRGMVLDNVIMDGEIIAEINKNKEESIKTFLADGKRVIKADFKKAMEAWEQKNREAMSVKP